MHGEQGLDMKKLNHNEKMLLANSIGQMLPVVVIGVCAAICYALDVWPDAPRHAAGPLPRERMQNVRDTAPALPVTPRDSIWARGRQR